MSVNRATILGNLGKEPELRYTESGKAVCNLVVATSDKWTDKNGEKKEFTEWHTVNVWGKQAENCNQYLSKGKQVFIEGSIKTRTWENKEGVKQYKTEINASNVQFIGSKEANVPEPKTEQKAFELPKANENFAASDIPF